MSLTSTSPGPPPQYQGWLAGACWQAGWNARKKGEPLPDPFEWAGIKGRAFMDGYRAAERAEGLR
jgi:hypothetical protein